MARIWMYHSEREQVLLKALAAQVKRMLGVDLSLDQVITYAVQQFGARLEADADVWRAAYDQYAQEYASRQIEEYHVYISDATASAVQAVGDLLPAGLGGLRGKKGFNRKLIILLALLTIGKSALEEEQKRESTSGH